MSGLSAGSPSDLARIRERLQEKIRGCIRFGRVKLSSGKETDFYFDGRLVSLDPEGSVLIAELMLEEIRKDGRIEAVGGLTSGADPLTSAIGVLSHERRVPLRLFYVRKEAKSHGTRRFIENPPPSGSRVVIFEDVVTSGGSTLDAIRAAEESGLKVAAVFSLVDREQGGAKVLAAYDYHPLFKKSEFGL